LPPDRGPRPGAEADRRRRADGGARPRRRSVPRPQPGGGGRPRETPHRQRQGRGCRQLRRAAAQLRHFAQEVIMSRLLIALVIVPVLAIAGCVPPAAWLPDSSGIVYTEGADDSANLVHYDVKTKKRNILAEKVDTGTLLPAVSPDGKQVAVARLLERKDKPYTVQLLFFGLDGKAGKQSKVFEVSNGTQGTETEPSRCASLLHWSPDGKKILVDFGTLGNDSAKLVYDVDRDDSSTITKATPIYGTQPIRPDSKGFLAEADLPGAKRGLAFLDWAGKVTPVEGIDASLNEWVEVSWEKGKVLWQSRDALFHIDTATAKAERSDAKLDVPLNKGEQVRTCTFADGKTRLCIFSYLETTSGGHNESFHRIEVRAPGQKPIVVAERTAGHAPFGAPSPDRNLVAVVARG